MRSLLAAVALTAAALGVGRFVAFRKQDGCLDQGGCWAHGEGRCEFADQAACDGLEKRLDPFTEPTLEADAWRSNLTSEKDAGGPTSDAS